MKDQRETTAPVRDPWVGSRRVVRVRPHLWRWIAEEARDGPVLEIGPGLRPTAPLDGSYFVDASPSALGALSGRGGLTAPGNGNLAFPAASFAVVLAFEVLEHVEEDEALLAEIARVLRPGGLLVLSVPIRMEMWSPLDEVCSHIRRYEPEELFGKLRSHGLEVEGYAPAPEPRPVVNRVRARILAGHRPAMTRLVQSLFFPMHAVFQRAFGRVRWRDPRDPVPEDAGDLAVYARRR